MGPRAMTSSTSCGWSQYLPGVLTGELFGHWRLETFAAQAVAARSFAASASTRSSGGGVITT